MISGLCLGVKTSDHNLFLAEDDRFEGEDEYPMTSTFHMNRGVG